MSSLTQALYRITVSVMRGVPMMSLVLRNLEKLQVDLAAIGSSHETETVDAVGEMVIALRSVLASADRTRRQVPELFDATMPTLLRAAR